MINCIYIDYDDITDPICHKCNSSIHSKLMIIPLNVIKYPSQFVLWECLMNDIKDNTIKQIKKGNENE